MADVQDAQLRKSIEGISKHFSSIVDLISTHYYVPKEEEKLSTSKKRKNRSEKEKMNKKLLSKKAKFLKLDPSEHKSSMELQEEIEKKEEEYFLDNAQNKDYLKPLEVSELPSASLEELREKLNMKIRSLQGKRNTMASSKRDERKNRKKKNKEAEIAKLKRMVESKNIKTAVNINEKETKQTASLPKNENGDIVFSKFDFVTANPKPKKKENMQLLLQKAKKKKIKLEKLKEHDEKKANDIEIKDAWSKVQKKAEGVKLKDDPKLLKRAIKSKEKQKEKSRKKWNERIENVEKQKQERQKLRKQHLKERRDSKVNKVKQVKKKKKVPGF